MHSYRHGFHAGNHADVLKHAVFVHVLDYFAQKETAFQVVDTHAGAGLYDLGHAWARQSGEADTGVQRLGQDGVDAIPPLLARYGQVLAQCRAQHGVQAYPGSPWLALHLLRHQDRLHVFETHPNELPALRRTLALRAALPARQRTHHATDGFDALKACLPPVSRRGVVIMDPSYEDKQDYRRVVQSIKTGLQRFATGCYVIWYPLVLRRERTDMLHRLCQLPNVAWLHATLQVKQAPQNGTGLYGSGLFVVNPPWMLRSALETALPWLCARLGQDKAAQVALQCST